MAIATIHYIGGHNQYLRDSDKDVAIEAYLGLRRGAPECVSTIKAVSLPPSWENELHGSYVRHSVPEFTQTRLDNKQRASGE